MNYVPKQSGSTPNYWCSWATQNFTLNQADPVGKSNFVGDQGARNARANLNESILFGPDGWIHDFPGIHGDLYFLFDDGWDVPYGVNPDKDLPRFGSVIPDAGRFPSCVGSPAQKLRTLNKMVAEAGWRGAGLWIAAQACGDVAGGPLMAEKEFRKYWHDRLLWSNEAGINFWKVDWGVRSGDLAFRRMLTEMGQEINPDFIVEHSIGSEPLNAFLRTPHEQGPLGGGRFVDFGDVPYKVTRLLQFSRMTRFYDLLAPLTMATALDRLAFFLTCPGSGLINVEDEVYLGAATGCSFGVMRSPRWQQIIDHVSNCHRRIQEVYRAARWQRIAPAFAVGDEGINRSREVLTDQWYFPAESTWFADVFDRTVTQSAPAVLARGINLPRVAAVESELPFVVASRHPNGAVAVGCLPRLSPSHRFSTPLAKIALDVDCTDRNIGIFGRFAEISFPVDSGCHRLFGQDLATDEAVELTSMVKQENGIMTVPGSVTRLLTIPDPDLSEPGILLHPEI